MYTGERGSRAHAGDEPLVVGTSAPMPIATKPDDAPVAPDDAARASDAALAVPARDPRGKTPARSRALLVTELQGLESLLSSTPKAAPQRPQIVRRLADSYSELARTADATPQIQSVARTKALAHYDLLMNDYPQHPQIDEAFYYKGLEHELAGDLPNARRSYYELIKRSPNSKLVPYAYFAFAEMFFAEAQADPSKLALAEQAYAEVLKYPPPANVLHAEAKRRMAEVKAKKRGP